MATVPHKAFYCTYHGLSGVLTRPADRVLFLEPHSGAVVTLEPGRGVPRCRDAMATWAEAMAQYLADMARWWLRGRMATSRDAGEGVR